MTFTSKQLDDMSRLEYDEVDKMSLADINEIRIDPALPPAERLLNYLQQIRNPYCFRCGATTVRVSFAANGADLETILKNYFISLKRG